MASSDYTFTEIKASEKNPYRQRVFTNKRFIYQTKFGLNEGMNVLNAIEKYLQVPFSLPKMDQAAVSGYGGGVYRK